VVSVESLSWEGIVGMMVGAWCLAGEDVVVVGLCCLVVVASESWLLALLAGGSKPKIKYGCRNKDG